MLTGRLYDSNGKCLLSFVDIFFLFAVVYFPYTVKLTFVLDHAPSPFHFVTREITSEARGNFPLCDSVVNKHTVNKINNKQDTVLKITL